MARLKTPISYPDLPNLDTKRTLVIVIDMVKGFVVEGAMADPGIAAIIPAIQNLLKIYPRHLFFADAHHPASREFISFPAHCLKGSEESELLDEFQQDPGRIINKNSTNGFVTEQFLGSIEALVRKYDHFIVTGCCTDICVLQFVLSLQGYFNEYDCLNKDIYVPADAVDTYNGADHKAEDYNAMALALMAMSGVKIARSEDHECL